MHKINFSLHKINFSLHKKFGYIEFFGKIYKKNIGILLFKKNILPEIFYKLKIFYINQKFYEMKFFMKFFQIFYINQKFYEMKFFNEKFI